MSTVSPRSSSESTTPIDAPHGSGLHRQPVIRRRTVPSGRAVIGALLIALAVVGAFALATAKDGRPSTRYVVVTKAVAPGGRLDATSLQLVAMQLDDSVRAQAFSDLKRVAGAIAVAPLNAGQLVQQAEIVPATIIDGQAVQGHELTFPVSRDRVPPALRRGERVAIVATYGSGTDARTTITAQQAVVVSVDAAESSATRTARLTVLLSDASTVVETAHASQVADLTVIRSTNTDATLPASFRPTTTGKN